MLRRNELVNAAIEILHREDYFMKGEKYNRENVARLIVDTILKLQQVGNKVPDEERHRWNREVNSGGEYK